MTAQIRGGGVSASNTRPRSVLFSSGPNKFFEPTGAAVDVVNGTLKADAQ